MAHKASLAGGSAKFPNPIQPTPLGSGKSSSAYTRVLCMHQNLTNQAHHPSRPGPGPARPWPLPRTHKSAVHAQECCACTRVLCMHKNLVHAQESCVV